MPKLVVLHLIVTKFDMQAQNSTPIGHDAKTAKILKSNMVAAAMLKSLKYHNLAAKSPIFTKFCVHCVSVELRANVTPHVEKLFKM